MSTEPTTTHVFELANAPLQPRIVAIDDSKTDVEVVRRCLPAEWESQLMVFHDPDEALEQISESVADLVLLDYQFGHTDGLTVFRKMRSAGLDVPVIFLTGHGDEAVAVEMMKSGASDYIPKDRVSSNSLKRAITNALDRYAMEQALEVSQSDLERANLDLYRQNEEILSFYHVLSHELKSPLTSMRGFLSIVLEGIAGPLSDQQTEYLTTALHGCDRITRIVNDLLDASRLETGKLPLILRSRQVNAILEEVCLEFRTTAEANGIELRFEPGEIPKVECDADRVAQVVANLMTNALKFTEEGFIRVSSSFDSETDSVVISVEDSGRGIPDEHQEQIFLRLQQCAHEDAAISGGLGLGLSLCKQLIELHNGCLVVDSALGEGSRFTFTLPREPGASINDEMSDDTHRVQEESLKESTS